MAHHQGPAHVGLQHGAQQQTQHKGAVGELEHLQEEAQHTGGEHDAHVEESVVQGEGAHHAQDAHGGPHRGLRHVQHLGGNFGGGQTEDEEYHVGQQHQDHDGSGEGDVLGEHLDAGLHAVHGQGADQDGGDGIAGDAQGHHGGHSAADHRIIGGGSHSQALQRALAVLLGVFAHLLGVAPGDDGGDVAAGGGNGADDRALNGGDQGGDGQLLGLLGGGQHPAQGQVDLAGLQLRLLLGLAEGVDLIEHLTDAEHADHHGDEGDAAQQGRLAEGESSDGQDGVQAHAGEQDARQAQDQALQHASVRHGHHHGQAEQGQHAVLRGVEGDGEPGDGGGEQDQAEGGENTTDEGIDHVDAQGQAALALAVQVVAVKGLTDGGGGAGGVHQNGGDASGENGGVPQAHQHGKAVGGRKPEGDGSHDGNAHGGRQAGQSADDGADAHTNGQKQQD